MSSHYLYLYCKKCEKLEPIYTGNIESWEFYDADWEGERIEVDKCIKCQEKNDE